MYRTFAALIIRSNLKLQQLNMATSDKISSRKKFLQWGAALISSVTVLSLLPSKKKAAPQTVKMLTEDGKLVEVDMTSIAGTKRKNITDQELKSWIKK